MLTASAAFALFVMLALASPIYYIAERIRIPYTVLLTVVGVLLVPLSTLEPFAFLREFTLTPGLLFYIFLPTLIFESAYNMNVRRVMQESAPIMLLAVVGYLISTFAIGGLLFGAFALLGLDVPFLITLLFGALISATDPVAVLALFKEYGAPRRLSMIFEGESLMNDATALAFFLVVLGLIEYGVSGSTIGLGALTFVSMLVGGSLLGLLFGALVAGVIGYFRHNETVAITLMLVLAHLSFISTELLNELLRHDGYVYLQFSPIIVTTIASLYMGNYGRYKITPRAEEFIEKFWSQFAFMSNSVIFILVGFLVAAVPPENLGLIAIPSLVAVLVVALARALSVYGTVLPYNWLSRATERVPVSWQHLLSWGSLRGALAVMLVLLIPPTLMVPGLEMPVRDFLIGITIACIFATLFIKAPLTKPIMARLKISTLTQLETAARDRARTLVHGAVHERLEGYAEKGYIPNAVGAALREEHGSHFATFATGTPDAAMVERTLLLYLIGREQEVLTELFTFDELTERVYKRVRTKLMNQSEEVEHGNLHPNPHATYDYRDVFENIAEWFRDIVAPETLENAIREQSLYYRAQAIIARKVLKEIARLEHAYTAPAFPLPMLHRARETYTTYLADAEEKRASITTRFPGVTVSLDATLADRSVYRVEEAVLEELRHRGLLTPKLFATLLEEYRAEAGRRSLKIRRSARERLSITNVT